MSTESADADVEAKASRNRSPNHPSFDLETAIERAAVLNKKYGKASVPIEDVAKTLGFKSVTSSANQCIAALRAYGLVSVLGMGAKRKVSVSEQGDRIIRNAPDRQALLKNAALTPPIQKELWEKYERDGGLPHNDVLRNELLWERPEGSRFTEEAVDGFIERFKATLAYAGVSADDKIDDGGEDEEESLNGDRPKVGDRVQWTSQGQFQFSAPRLLKGVSDDGDWGFVEGTNSGIAMSELSVVEKGGVAAAQNPAAGRTPPPNPFAGRPPGGDEDGAFITFPLRGGNVMELRLHKKATQKQFDQMMKLLAVYGDSIVDEDAAEDE